MLIRQTDQRDYPAIEKAMAGKFWNQVNKQWLRLVDPVKAEKVLKNQTNIDSLIIDETFLLLVSVGKPWYADSEILQELLTLKLYPLGSGSALNIPKALEEIGRSVGVKGLAAGFVMAAKPEPLTKLYCRNGFEEQSCSVYKALT